MYKYIKFHRPLAYTVIIQQSFVIFGWMSNYMLKNSLWVNMDITGKANMKEL